MRAIPELNLDRLIGQQLQQICIGRYDLQFRFMHGDRIRCTGKVSVLFDGTEIHIFHPDTWEDVTPLPKIVGCDVESWRVETSHVFSIILTGGAVISFESEDSLYEDFIVDPEVLVW